MINNYEIKKINNEEVLFLFLDNNTEFANMHPEKKKTINNEINTYIKNNKINFNGKKIILMAGSFMLGMCLLTTPPHKNKDIDYNYTTNLITLNETIVDEKTETKEEENKVEIKEEETVKENENISSKPTTPATIKPTPKPPVSTTKPSKPATSVPTKPTPPSENVTESKPDTKPQVPNVVTGKMITIKRSNGTILNIELEEYLIGVVAAEMPASFNNEALKAGAIAARTYALKAIQDGKTLTDTTSTQVYKDNNQLKALWGNSFNAYYNKVKNAVESTKGLVMYYNNSLINAFYHSTSNGYTEDSTAVFGSFPYLQSVESPVDKNVSSYLRTTTFTYENISNKLGIPITSLSNINIVRNNSNRISSITIDTNTYDGVKFRTILGLRSTDFDITLNENNIVITTRGFGHGVGMSQYGANEYAKQGWSYSQILKHYYTGISIKKY